MNKRSDSGTDFGSRVAILSEFWLMYRTEEEFLELVRYADLGLPMAYLLENNYVDETEDCFPFVNQAFDALLQMFELEDTGFESLDEILYDE